RDVHTIENTEIDATLATFVEAGGVQCGACTPGIVLTLRALLERDPHPNRDTLRDALAGNLCRCTGYERILRAVEEATR
ncbi:MAG: 2Fe-2S iron-sulfur cluster-binding protein, partial [Planctomycetota bacterium]